MTLVFWEKVKIAALGMVAGALAMLVLFSHRRKKSFVRPVSLIDVEVGRTVSEEQIEANHETLIMAIQEVGSDIEDADTSEEVATVINEVFEDTPTDGDTKKAASKLNTLFFLLLLFPHTSFGGEICVEAQAITAPCEGVLIPAGWAEDIARIKGVELPTCIAEKDRLSALLDVEKAARVSYLAAQWEQNILIRELQAPPPFWKKPEVWAGVGFLTGVTLTVAILR